MSSKCAIGRAGMDQFTHVEHAWTVTDQQIMETLLFESGLDSHSSTSPSEVWQLLPTNVSPGSADRTQRRSTSNSPTKETGRKRASDELKKARHREVQRRFIQRKKEEMIRVKRHARELEKRFSLLQLESEKAKLEQENASLREKASECRAQNRSNADIHTCLMDETDLVQANYVPLSPDYVSQLIAMTVEESDLASQDNSYDSTGLTVLGWRDRRKVEKSAVRFVMSKQFPHIRANDLMTNTWNRITNPKTYPTFFSPALVIKMVVVQRIDDNTMVIYRSIYNPQSSKIGRSLEVMGRVWRGDECLIFTRSVDCPNLRALFGEVNSWSQVITWLRFAVPETNANGCDFEYGGCYGNVVAAGIMYWLMEVLFIVLRYESVMIAPIFALCSE